MSDAPESIQDGIALRRLHRIVRQRVEAAFWEPWGPHAELPLPADVQTLPATWHDLQTELWGARWTWYARRVAGELAPPPAGEPPSNYMLTPALWREQAGFPALPGEHPFRRSADRAAYTAGLIQPDDYIGRWLYEDLYRAAQPLRWSVLHTITPLQPVASHGARATRDARDFAPGDWGEITPQQREQAKADALAAAIAALADGGDETFEPAAGFYARRQTEWSGSPETLVTATWTAAIAGIVFPPARPGGLGIAGEISVYVPAGGWDAPLTDLHGLGLVNGGYAPIALGSPGAGPLALTDPTEILAAGWPAGQDGYTIWQAHQAQPAIQYLCQWSYDTD